MQDQKPEKATAYLRVKVVDHTKEGSPAVNIKVPLGVVQWGMKMAQAFSPQMKDVHLDWDSIDAMVHEGGTGKIVEVEDEAEHKTIEVWLE
jgi:NADH:ubiquinone oxidoreductase subunit F (NADH-binding)